MNFKSIKKNYIYNLILTTINMIFPLVTAPYLSYVLGAVNIGKVNYATSIANWFILFAAFGIPRYGIREISRNRGSRMKLSCSFWNLLLIQFVLSIVTIILYILFIFSFKSFHNDISLYLLMIVMIVLNIFSIDWFYQGIEEYGYITGRNIIVKIISLILIFLMIKERNHYGLYALINILGLSFNNVLNYINIKNYIDKKIYKIKFSYYIKQLRVYFMTTLIIALYTQLDQIFVGALSQKDLAYYLRSKTVQGIGISIVNSLITVFIPRTAYLAKYNYDEYKDIIKKSINYIYILSFPCSAGVFLLSKEVMFLLGGQEFFPATNSLKIISILILISSIGGWQINQILIPNKREGLALKIQTIGAIVSVTLNLILIPRYSYIGAAITWVLTEIFLLIVESICIKYKCRGIHVKYINKSCIKYLAATGIMSVIVLFIKKIANGNNIILLVSLVTSPIIYFGSIILFKDEIILEIIKGIKHKYIYN
ncbi:oligosaccharide flippase family protein [Clostridium tertium]|jgi:O-antigen/teichoic acid export membrane protein|uniref:oligosaccharide flippase family protein n=1 Tax=Clostridium tertium TaxID=1559 RepID=UPI000DCFC4FB|nr:oligosaccharide flippase family protein [Clostridium tertium]MDB1941839.1 oligosaccharide flippase family protein [Clostridium tertium]